MKIYVSGPITGNPEWEEQFLTAEKLLRKEGHAVVSPREIYIAMRKKEEKEPAYSDLMKTDIIELLSCEAIYLLKGWPKSRGAKVEMLVAEICGLDVIRQDEAESEPYDGNQERRKNEL